MHSVTAPIALQLYSVREAMSEDFAAAVRRVAEIGYIGVEPALSTLGATPTQAGKLFRELGLRVPSAHTSVPVGESKNTVLDAMAALGGRRIIPPLGADRFETIDLTRRTCDLLNEAHAVAIENGFSLGVHNHWWEFQQVEGRYVYHVMLEHLHPQISFEIDTYWVQLAGLDPAAVVRELGSRAPLLHIKDGPATMDDPMTAVGDGEMDVQSIVKAARGTSEWIIVELDRCATDMMAAVEKSYDYLVAEGLAYGHKD